MNLLILINSSLEVIYCSTTLSNHGSIRFRLTITPGGYEMSFVSYSHLILLISGQTFEVIVALNFF